MLVHFGWEGLRPEWPSSVVAIGTFDGVHLGHRAVVSEAVRLGAEQDLPAWVVTFDRHPAAILAPERCPPAVSSLGANLERLRALGVGGVLVLKFDQALSQTPAQEFLDRIVRDRLRASAVAIGHDFAFGRGREGTGEWLAARLPTTVVPPFTRNGVRVSSSAVRQAVSEGRMEDAVAALGRPFEVEGVVVGGQRLGRTLGYPTLNLARSFSQVAPADGVYAGRCRTPRGSFVAAASLGMRPTVEGAGRSLEAYLLDYDGASLYGAPVQLELHHRLRGEEKFPDLDALKAQMARDVEATRRLVT